MNEFYYNNVRSRERIKMYATLSDYSGAEIKIEKGYIYHMLYHIACFIVVIDNIIKISSSRRFPAVIMYNIIWDFDFNLQREIWVEVEEIDPGFSMKLDDYKKRLSIISQQKRVMHDDLYNLLISLKDDLYQFCKYFGDHNTIDNEVKKQDDYYVITHFSGVINFVCI